MTNLRYPGPKPFTTNEEALFFGRKDETERLNSIVSNNRLTVLLGRSGYGKSSLIQAGVIPYFQNMLSYLVIQIRFTGPGQQPLGLVGQLRQELGKELDHQDIFFGDLTGISKPGLWQTLKSVQWKYRDSKRGLLIVLDQFEEVFKYTDDYLPFANELAELVHNRMPETFQTSLMKKIETDEAYYATNKDKYEFIRNEMPTTFLFGIRSDRMFLLDELGNAIPAILSNRFRLEALSLDKIRTIIEKPALAMGDFDSPRFTFSTEFIGAIRDYLAETGCKEGKGRSAIEAFELQIICQHVELAIIEKYKTAPPPEGKLPEAGMDLVPDGFDKVIEGYYISIIRNREAFNDFERLITRFLIERKLIDRKSGSRVCVDKTSILPFGITDDLLKKIVETRIIRKELNTVSGESFELSHDSLIRAIQQASMSAKLGNLDEHLSRYYGRASKQFTRKSLLSTSAALEKKLVDKFGNLVRLEKRKLEGRPNLMWKADQLLSRGILYQEGPPGKEVYVLNEVFQDTVIAKVNKSHLSKLKNYTTTLIATLIVLVLIVFLGTRALHFSVRENALRIATATDTREANDPQSPGLLRLFNDLYRIIRLSKDSLSQETSRTKLVRQFNNMCLYGDSVRSDSLYGIEYTVSGDDSLLLSLRNPSPFTDVTIKPQLSTAVIYDNEGNRKWTFPNLDYASLRGHELYTLKNDSLYIYDLNKLRAGSRSPRTRSVQLNYRDIERQLQAKAQNMPGSQTILSASGTTFRISYILPIKHLGNDSLLVVYKMRFSRPPFVSSTENMLAVVALKNGNVLPLQGMPPGLLLSLERFYLRYAREEQYPKYFISDSANRIASLTQDGYNNHYFEAAGLKGPASYSRISIPADLFPIPAETGVSPVNANSIVLSSFNRDAQPSYGSPVTPAAGVADTIHLARISLSGKLLYPKDIPGHVVNLMQNSDNTVTLFMKNKIMILDRRLEPIFSCPFKADSFSIGNPYAALRKNELLYTANDSLLILVSGRHGDAPRVSDLHGFINSFSYSTTGDSIFCTVNDRRLQKTVLFILDGKNLKTLFTCYNYWPYGDNKIHGVVISAAGSGDWYVVKLRKDKTKFHNMDPDEVSDWINRYVPHPHVSDSLRDRYHFVGDDIIAQIKNLIHE